MSIYIHREREMQWIKENTLEIQLDLVMDEPWHGLSIDILGEELPDCISVALENQLSSHPTIEHGFPVTENISHSHPTYAQYCNPQALVLTQ